MNIYTYQRILPLKEDPGNLSDPRKYLLAQLYKGSQTIKLFRFKAVDVGKTLAHQANHLLGIIPHAIRDHHITIKLSSM